MEATKSYLICRAAGPVRLACDDEAWAGAERLSIDEYPWYRSGQKQGTDVALLYDAEALYALFVCEDRHISAAETRPNGNVYLDSCVELFAMPAPDGDGGYFNFEANCCGTAHLGFGPARQGRRLADEPVLRRIRVATSVATPIKSESTRDDGWWLAARLPFAAISEFAGFPVAPEPQARWRANFYRCGGKTDPQYACWNTIRWERPDFHRPEFFGELRFQ
jgi:hypothetical protein